MDKVSIIIPGRCEKYFQPTIDSVLKNATGDIEVIPVIDGYVPDPPLVITDPRVKPIFLKDAIGQRAGYNLGVKESTGKYVMKLDAHAMVGPGFDEILKSHCPPKTVVLPEMRRLDVEKWKDKKRGKTHFMYFGLDVFCHYWKDYGKRPEAKVEYPEVLTGQGSCWFTTREWNDYIGILDERLGSWGKVGIEISLKTWLCGGSQIVNKNTWQAHWFRAGEGRFPYPFSGRQLGRAKDITFNEFYFAESGAFENQVRPFKWLMDKFAPIPGWEAYLADGYKSDRVIVYYTDNKIEMSLAAAVRNHLKKMAGPIPIISVSQKPLDFGKNICVGFKEKSYKSMYEQMLVGVKAAPENSIVYLCEHDIFYHPSHFEKVPEEKDCVYINQNKFYWKNGYNSFFKSPKQKAWSQTIGNREYLLNKLEQKTEDGLRVRWFKWDSNRPNVDVRHDDNLSAVPKYLRQWLIADKGGTYNLPGWGGPKHFKSIVKYKGTMRFDIIRFLIGLYEYGSYLEIGVDKNHTWNNIECEIKHGVDPNKDCTFKMTSDEFFLKNKNEYDLIFIDGLHEQNQVKRDIENALNILTYGGVIVVHDCNPRNEQEQIAPKLPGQKIWIGDGWKAFVELRQRKDIEMHTVDTNNGIGIIRKGIQNPIKIKGALDYKNFVKNKVKWLNLKSVQEFKAYENDRVQIRKYKPMSEKAMELHGRVGTICQSLRDIYHAVPNDDLKYKLRVCMAMAKAMNKRLKQYKETSECIKIA